MTNNARSTRKATRTLILVSLVLLLASCSPSVKPAELNRISSTPAFSDYYPLNAGLVWQYHYDGEPLDATPIMRTALGPTLIGGTLHQRLREHGKGLDTTYYYNTANGVKLSREERPGTSIDYDPPVRVYPSGTLELGQRWSGTTTATITYPQAPAARRTETMSMDYVYTVIDERKVTTPLGTYDALIINLTATQRTPGAHAPASHVSNEVWFVPFKGELRTSTGLFLTNSNNP